MMSTFAFHSLKPLKTWFEVFSCDCVGVVLSDLTDSGEATQANNTTTVTTF